MKGKTLIFVLVSCAILNYSCSKKQESESLSNPKSIEATEITKKTSVVLRGQNSLGGANQLTYSYNSSGTTLTVQTSNVPSQPDDAQTLVSVGVIVDENNYNITIPDDGKQYWVIPFNSSYAPVKVPNGSTGAQICDCTGTGTGTCTMEVTTNGGTCEKKCKENTCSSDCELKESPGPLGGGFPLQPGSNLIIQADVLIYNGTIFN